MNGPLDLTAFVTVVEKTVKDADGNDAVSRVFEPNYRKPNATASHKRYWRIVYANGGVGFPWRPETKVPAYGSKRAPCCISRSRWPAASEPSTIRTNASTPL